MAADIRPFYQGDGSASTLGEVCRLFDEVEPTEALFSFAYLTTSGVAEFERNIGKTFWASTRSRWLIGIDHGRSQPEGLKRINGKQKSIVRIVNGLSVVHSPRFRPTTDFHMKACFFLRPSDNRFAMVAGSGNFSRNGLKASIEFGTSIMTDSEDSYKALIEPTYEKVRLLWSHSSLISQVLPLYQATWTPGSAPPATALPNAAQVAQRQFFWIEAGYVTRNRGPDRPGNQIDMPKGSHRFFGLQAATNQPRNSVIGAVQFSTPSGSIVRNLRLGNNDMEKLTLPFSEQYPFGTYEGKILEFRRIAAGFEVNAYEIEEFERLLANAANAIVLKSQRGRAYGYR